MGIVSIMWSAWSAAVVLMAVVGIYSSRVGRYEGAQVFLAESSSHAKSEQEMIAARLSRLRPLRLSAMALMGLMTLLVFAYYVLWPFRYFL